MIILILQFFLFTGSIFGYMLPEYLLLVYNDWLVLRHKNLHYNPADEISHGTDAEHNHVATLLAVEAHEAEC